MLPFYRGEDTKSRARELGSEPSGPGSDEGGPKLLMHGPLFGAQHVKDGQLRPLELVVRPHQSMGIGPGGHVD